MLAPRNSRDIKNTMSTKLTEAARQAEFEHLRAKIITLERQLQQVIHMLEAAREKAQRYSRLTCGRCQHLVRLDCCYGCNAGMGNYYVELKTLAGHVIRCAICPKLKGLE
jgi:hypothetical protein